MSYEHKTDVSELLHATTNILLFLDDNSISKLTIKAEGSNGEKLSFTVESGLALKFSDVLKEMMITRLAELETSYFIRTE